MKKVFLKIALTLLVASILLSIFASCDQGNPGVQGEQGIQGEKGETGAQGEKGDDGVGIEKVEKTSSDGFVDTYTITFTDGTTKKFDVTNGTCQDEHKYGEWKTMLTSGNTKIEYRECSSCKDTQIQQSGVISIDGTNNSSGSSEVPEIVELNKDLEPFIIQSSHGRTEAFEDQYEVLTFVHCADMHASQSHWNRMVEFTNYYSDYIDFVVHAGDYCGGNQSDSPDLYAGGPKCDVPIFNVPGNHDTMPAGSSQQSTASKESVYNIIVGDHAENWDVTFMPGEYSMSYFRYYETSNILLVVLDNYYDIAEQQKWLEGVLGSAKKNGMHVITVTHEPTSAVVDAVDTPFHSINDWESLYTLPKRQFEDILSEFVADGGTLIANLAGHEHHDLFSYTLGGVLNMVVENGNSFKYWCDADRVEGTRTYDSFNVVSVDTNLGIITAIRVGNNADNFGREKSVMCYDYINKKLITGGNVASSGSSAEIPEWTGWSGVPGTTTEQRINIISGEVEKRETQFYFGGTTASDFGGFIYGGNGSYTPAGGSSISWKAADLIGAEYEWATSTECQTYAGNTYNVGLYSDGGAQADIYAAGCVLVANGGIAANQIFYSDDGGKTWIAAGDTGNFVGISVPSDVTNVENAGAAKVRIRLRYRYLSEGAKTNGLIYGFLPGYNAEYWDGSKITNADAVVPFMIIPAEKLTFYAK